MAALRLIVKADDYGRSSNISRGIQLVTFRIVAG
jgi:hypothetical protein